MLSLTAKTYIRVHRIKIKYHFSVHAFGEIILCHAYRKEYIKVFKKGKHKTGKANLETRFYAVALGIVKDYYDKLGIDCEIYLKYHVDHRPDHQTLDAEDKLVIESLTNDGCIKYPPSMRTYLVGDMTIN